MRRAPPLAIACALSLAGPPPVHAANPPIPVPSGAPAVAAADAEKGVSQGAGIKAATDGKSVPGAAQAARARRPYSVDDLLALESLGPAAIAPDGRWGVLQTYDRWDAQARFDLDSWGRLGLGRVTRIDLVHGDAPPRPAFAQAVGVGYTAGPLSPSGQRLAVLRLQGRALELGVATLETGGVTWLGVSPPLDVWGRTVAWRNDDELIAIDQAPDTPGSGLGLGWLVQERTTRAWAQAAAGRYSGVVLGSGAYRDARPQASPSALVRIDLRGGGVTALARAAFVDLEIAPGGGHVAALAEAEDLAPGPGPLSTGTPFRRRALTLVDLATLEVRAPCPTCDLDARLLAWSASGQTLLIHDRGLAGVRPAAYWRIPARGAAAALDTPGLRPVLSGTADHGLAARGTWLGETPVIPAQPVSGPSRTGWWRLERDGPQALPPCPAGGEMRLVGVSGPSPLMACGEAVFAVALEGALTPIATGLIQRLTGRTVRLAATPRPAQDLAVITPGPAGRRLAPLQGGGALTLGADEVPLALSARGLAAVTQTTDDQGVQSVWLVRAGQARRRLLTLNSGLAGVAVSRPVPIRHVGPDGQALTSWLYPPTGPLAREGRAPLVVIPYPGETHAGPPTGQAPGSLRFSANAQVIAARGYAVLVPSLPYPAQGEPMDGLAEQILQGVDAAASQAAIDPQRVAIWGHSYGGYAALAAATQSRRFSAIIASASASNLLSYYGRIGPLAAAAPEVGLPIAPSAGWFETGQGRMGAPPWVDPQRYLRNSPIVRADRITAPVLLIHGDLDKDLSQPQGLFAALYRQNKDAVLVTYRGEGHIIQGPANVRDEYDRVFGFLDRDLRPGPQDPPPSHSSPAPALQ